MVAIIHHPINISKSKLGPLSPSAALLGSGRRDQQEQAEEQSQGPHQSHRYRGFSLSLFQVIRSRCFQERHNYQDPVTDFLTCLYIKYDFDEAQEKLRQCEEVRIPNLSRKRQNSFSGIDERLLPNGMSAGFQGICSTFDL